MPRISDMKRAQGGWWHSEIQQKFGATVGPSSESLIMPHDTIGMPDGPRNLYYAPAFLIALH